MGNRVKGRAVAPGEEFQLLVRASSGHDICCLLHYHPIKGGPRNFGIYMQTAGASSGWGWKAGPGGKKFGGWERGFKRGYLTLSEGERRSLRENWFGLKCQGGMNATVTHRKKARGRW